MSLSYRYGKSKVTYDGGVKAEPGMYYTVHDRKNRVRALIVKHMDRWNYWMQCHDGNFGLAYGHQDLAVVMARVEEDEHWLDGLK
jgi:hypothetical protein